MSGHMHNPQLARRASRSSGSQPAYRPSRVEKPKSHHNSPRTMERRKTTTETKLYATLDDHYRMMFGLEPEDEYDERPQPNRPVSWHPSSTHFQSSQSASYFEPQQDWSRQYSTSPRHSVQGSDFYSLSTRNSTYEPMSHSSTHLGVYGMHRGSDESDNSWQSVPQHTPSYAHSAINTPTTEPLPWYLQQWAQKNQNQAMLAQQNTSSDFLPIQHPSKQDDDMEEDGGEKLVALGLYDPPEPSMSWNGLTESTGKGLKLEETWQPPEEDDDEDDDADDASSEASEEPSPPLPATHNNQHLQLPVHVKSQTPGSMEGQSFFFDDDETVSKEWWFQQMKQPSMPMRDTGLGYGWL
ncbi:hypothetical protein FB567DRAFT_94965 [Paraphoma chrysanthemicola]|uniref:Uncharacterized protein n=1 Tax=Paraphoma chrysanthemicola TaxID=798071 RepID=A0A8K0VWG0_9PLEO|nr:hypothetical protein FB567DRAFT_94965 [Paraphoma chrysanthemicola]